VQSTTQNTFSVNAPPAPLSDLDSEYPVKVNKEEGLKEECNGGATPKRSERQEEEGLKRSDGEEGVARVLGGGGVVGEEMEGGEVVPVVDAGEVEKECVVDVLSTISRGRVGGGGVRVIGAGGGGG
jgi:hypothetical protein